MEGSGYFNQYLVFFSKFVIYLSIIKIDINICFELILRIVVVKGWMEDFYISRKQEFDEEEKIFKNYSSIPGTEYYREFSHTNEEGDVVESIIDSVVYNDKLEYLGEIRPLGNFGPKLGADFRMDDYRVWLQTGKMPNGSKWNPNE